MTTPRSEGLLSPSDVAELAGVQRPVVSNWRKRHADFPEPVAGTGAKPLFRREAVVVWLRQRGHQVKDESVGSLVWAAFNATRGRLPSTEAADLLILLATLKRANPADFEKIVHAPAGLEGAIDNALTGLRHIPALRSLRDLPRRSIPRLGPEAVPIVDAVSRIGTDDLAEAVDFVLERLARSEIKAGAESGFIGSRTAILLASLVGSTRGTVYDPACGIANVLIRVATHHRAERIVGSDINHNALRIAAQRAFLHGVDIEFIAGDVLEADPDPTLKADIVVAEPPFGLAWDPSSKLSDPRFTFGVPPRMAADLAWVQHALAHLAPKGRAFVLTAPGAMFRSGEERQIRAGLLNGGHIEAVVGLPAKMLPHTSIAPALWVLRHGEKAGDVLLIDASGVDEAENEVPTWLNRKSLSTQEVGAPHAVVPVTDLLAADSVLTPAKWTGRQPIDDATLVASFNRAFGAMAHSMRLLENSSLPYEQLRDLPKPRMTTVRELIDKGVLDLRTGRPDKARALDETSAARIVRAADIRDRHLPPIEALATSDHPDLTEEGDVLVTTMNEVRAVVDESGGHLPSTGVDRLRVKDTSVLAPGYLAAIITGSWNSHLQTGTTIRRAPIRDLEIPLVPLNEQTKIVDAFAAVSLIREQSALLNAEAREGQNAILDAVRHNVPVGASDLVEQPTAPAPRNSKGNA